MSIPLKADSTVTHKMIINKCNVNSAQLTYSTVTHKMIINKCNVNSAQLTDSTVTHKMIINKCNVNSAQDRFKKIIKIINL